MNNTPEKLQAVADALLKADTVYIFGHMIPDGDCMGSSSALCRALRSLGKTAWVIMEDEYPKNMGFLDNGCCKWIGKEELPAPDLSIAVDCGDLTRFPKRAELFKSAKVTACVDHHMNSGGMADFEYIDEFAAANCENIYKLINDHLHAEIDKETAEAIYTGLATDTGNFSFSNTTEYTHLLAAELYKKGIDAYRINVRIFQSESLPKVMLRSRVLSEMKVLCGGRLTVALCPKSLLAEYGATDNETDGINSAMRDIYGVEAACLVRERPDGSIKIGMRSKNVVNVAEIAEKLGGGGHIKAAGCTLHCTIEEAEKMLTDALTEAIEKVGEDVLKSFDM